MTYAYIQYIVASGNKINYLSTEQAKVITSHAHDMTCTEREHGGVTSQVQMCSCDHSMPVQAGPVRVQLWLASRRAGQLAGSTCERAPWCRHIIGKKPFTATNGPLLGVEKRPTNLWKLLLLFAFFISSIKEAGRVPCRVLLVRSHVTFVWSGIFIRYVRMHGEIFVRTLVN